MRLFVIGCLFTATLFSQPGSLHVEERLDYKNGASFANVGPYERIKAKAKFGTGATAEVDFLKPRDPAKGNGTLIYLSSIGPSEQALLEAGFSVLRVEGNPPEAIRDVVAFLRYGGDLHLIGDQRQFLKRFIAFGSGDNAKTLSFMAQQNLNKSSNGSKIFDVFWLHDTDVAIEPTPETRVHLTKGKPLDALAIQLHEQLSKGI